MVALPGFLTHVPYQTGLNNYTLSKLLAANIPEIYIVPTDDSGVLANFVTFGKGEAADIFVQCFPTGGTTDRVTNGTFAEYVTNGAFASDTGWTKGTGWTIAAGVADCDGSQTAASLLSQTLAIALIPGYTYTLTFTVATVSAGTITASVGGTAGTVRSTAATFKETFVAGATSVLAFSADADFVGTIDNVTITAWVLGTGWTTDGATAIASGAISTNLSQTANTAYPLIAGQTYYVTYTATASAGSFVVSLGGGTAGAARSTSATFSEYLVAGATQEIVVDATGFTGTFDTFTVIPAAQVPGDTTTGQSPEQNPKGYFLSGKAASISIVSAGTPTVTCNFYK